MPRRKASISTRKSKSTFNLVNIADVEIPDLESIRRSESTYSGVCTNQEKVLNEVSCSKVSKGHEVLNAFKISERQCAQNIKTAIFPILEERILLVSDVSSNMCTNINPQHIVHTKDMLENPILCYRNEGTIVSEMNDTKNISAISCSIQDNINQITKNNDIKTQENIQNSKAENVDMKLNTSTDEACKIPFIYSDMSKNRKRKWISKKVTEILSPILSISTDSLKNLISDVHPVPLSDIHLDSSSEVEEVSTEWEQVVENSPKTVKGSTCTGIPLIEKENIFIPRQIHNLTDDVSCTILRSPSPSRNKESNILYITNLVRPFTVLQLKGLLVRTGKIVDDGFWIDRIKSKCFVQYETEDEAIETRHALHGIRWPASNPKCLNVDFGKMEDMQRAIMLKKNADDMNSFSKHDRKSASEP